MFKKIVLLGCLVTMFLSLAEASERIAQVEFVDAATSAM